MMDLPASCEQGVHRAHKARSSICKGTVHRFLLPHIWQQNERVCCVQTNLHNPSMWRHMDRQCSARSTPRPVQSAAHLYLRRQAFFYSVASRRRTQLCNESESSNLYGSFFFIKHSVSYPSIKRKLVHKERKE
jgi:hypothetical protein